MRTWLYLLLRGRLTAWQHETLDALRREREDNERLRTQLRDLRTARAVDRQMLLRQAQLLQALAHGCEHGETVHHLLHHGSNA